MAGDSLSTNDLCLKSFIDLKTGINVFVEGLMGRAQGETRQGQECVSMQTIVTQGGYWNPYEVVST